MGAVYSVPFGEGSLSFRLPRGMTARVAAPARQPPLPDLEAAIHSALDAPLGSPSLEELVNRIQPRSVCVAFTDATRACPDHLLVPAVLDRLAAAGVPDEAVTLLCAVGLHRRSTQAERQAKLGPAVVNRYRILDHDACDPDGVVRVGHTPDGIPLAVNRLACRADLLIATGLVEPHQYAGFSGGAKTVAIGCGGEATVAATHGPAMLDRPGVRLGHVEGNPFQEAVRRAGLEAGLRFVVNVVQDEERRVLRIAAGAPAAVHDRLVACARQIFEVEVPHAYDLAVAGVGAPKDVNLYQASRAITYLQLTATPAVRPGGVFILPAPCPEGAGEGAGEQRFLAALRDAPDVETMLAEMRLRGYPPGAQRAFMVGQVLAQTEVIVVGAHDARVVCDAKMTRADSMEEAFAHAVEKLGSPLKALIVPHALQTLIRVA